MTTAYRSNSYCIAVGFPPPNSDRKSGSRWFQNGWVSAVFSSPGRIPTTGLRLRQERAELRFFHRKTRCAKTSASSSAAMANAVPAEFSPSIDRKKGRFLGLFCRKTGVRPKLFNTLLCVFICFWDSWLFQTLAPQGEPAAGRLQNKSCLKTYRRFFVRSGMCLNKSYESRNDWPG